MRKLFLLGILVQSAVAMAVRMVEQVYIPPRPKLDREEVARLIQTSSDLESKSTLQKLARAMAPHPLRSADPDAQLEQVAQHSSNLAELPQTEFSLRKQAMEIAFLSSSTLPPPREKPYVERMARLRDVLLQIYKRDEDLLRLRRYRTVTAKAVLVNSCNQFQLAAE